MISSTRVKVVLGYASSTEVHVALERGEVDGRCGIGYDSLMSRYSHWVKDKKIHILAQFGLSAKHPDIADVPWVMDLAKTQEDKQITEPLLGPNDVGRPYMAPLGIPADRLACCVRPLPILRGILSCWRRPPSKISSSAS